MYKYGMITHNIYKYGMVTYITLNNVILIKNKYFQMHVNMGWMQLTLGGELIEPFKNPKFSIFSNTSQTLDLISSKSYLNGTFLDFWKIYQFGPILALKVDFLTIIVS